MANRRFEMFEYRQVLTRMRLGDSDRAIAAAGLIVELNTAGWHKPCKDGYPSLDILKHMNSPALQKRLAG